MRRRPGGLEGGRRRARVLAHRLPGRRPAARGQRAHGVGLGQKAHLAGAEPRAAAQVGGVREGARGAGGHEAPPGVLGQPLDLAQAEAQRQAGASGGSVPLGSLTWFRLGIVAGLRRRSVRFGRSDRAAPRGPGLVGAPPLRVPAPLGAGA